MSSPPVSPGPPPYQTPQQSPNPNIHEIDSTHIHEVGGMVPPSAAVQALHLSAMSHELDSATVQSNYRSSDQLVEGSRWSSRKPTDISSVDIEDGSPRGKANTPVGALLSSDVIRGDGNGGHGPPRSSTLTPVSRMQSSRGNSNRPEGRDSYVSWQSMS